MNSILVNILLLLGSSLIIVIIYVLIKVSKTISTLQFEISNLNRSIVPLFEQVNSLVVRVDKTLDSFSEHREALSEAVNNIRNVTRHVYRLESALHDQLEPSILGIASTLSGVRKGILAFSENWRKHH